MLGKHFGLREKKEGAKERRGTVKFTGYIWFSTFLEQTTVLTMDGDILKKVQKLTTKLPSPSEK